ATILSLLAVAGIMLLGLKHIDSTWIMAGVFFFVGIFLFGPDSIISGTAAIDFGTKRGAGTATGFINGVGSIGAILGGYLPGIMTDAKSWTPFLAISLSGIVLAAIILLPLWHVKPPTS